MIDAGHLAIVVASPDLLTVKCHTVEQMALVNLLCWVAEEADCPLVRSHLE